MTILGRYIGKEFTLYFLTCFLALVAVTVLFSALAEISLLSEEKGFELFLEVVLSGIPPLIEIVTPISVLLATVLTFAALSERSEIVAMQAAGLGLLRLAMPILMIGALIAGLYYFNQSYLASWWGTDKHQLTVNHHTKNSIWRYFQGRLFFVEDLSRMNQSAKAANVYSFDKTRGLWELQRMEELSLKEKKWHIAEASKFTFDERRIKKEKDRGIVQNESTFPVVFQKELSQPKYSRFGEMIQDLQIKIDSGINYKDDLFALYQKVSGLLSIFVMILLALPFSFFSGREAKVATGIVISILFGFVFWLTDQIFVSLFRSDLLIPELAAFGGNLTFICLSLILIKRRQT